MLVTGMVRVLRYVTSSSRIQPIVTMMHYQVTAVVIVVVFVAIFAQLELDSEPLIAKRAVTLSSDEAETFRMVTNLQNFQKWISVVVHVADNPEEPPQVRMGKSFRVFVSTPFKTIPFQARVTKYHPTSEFEFEANSVLFSMRSSFEVELGSMAGFSKLTWKIHAKRRSYLYLITVVQPLKFFMSHQVTASLFNLKVLLH